MPLKSDPQTWSDPRHRLGVEGERVAIAYLVRAGWSILAHRLRMGRPEIDVVARKGLVVAFVEVKTRWGRSFGSPLEAVTWAKQREIGRVARAWLDRHGRSDDVYRFDVIGVTMSGDRPRVDHVENAFQLGWR